jgi:hypothetical protein
MCNCIGLDRLAQLQLPSAGGPVCRVDGSWIGVSLYSSALYNGWNIFSNAQSIQSSPGKSFAMIELLGIKTLIIQFL